MSLITFNDCPANLAWPSYRTAPQLLGYLFNWALFGVLTAQVYYYYFAFPKDRYAYKAVVAVVYLLEVLQTFSLTAAAIDHFILHFGNTDIFFNLKTAVLSVNVLAGIAAFIVQVFYAYRIHILSNTKLGPCMIIVLALSGLVGALISGIKGFQLGHLSAELSKNLIFVIPAIIWWSCSALCDVCIALYMTYLLSRRGTGFRETQILINRLTRLAIETGICTALVAIVVLLAFVLWPQTSYNAPAALSLAKLYSNSLLVLFNSRMRIAGSREEQLLSRSRPHPSSSRTDERPLVRAQS